MDGLVGLLLGDLLAIEVFFHQRFIGGGNRFKKLFSVFLHGGHIIGVDFAHGMSSLGIVHILFQIQQVDKSTRSGGGNHDRTNRLTKGFNQRRKHLLEIRFGIVALIDEKGSGRACGRGVFPC